LLKDSVSSSLPVAKPKIAPSFSVACLFPLSLPVGAGAAF
jgi:hypothetical protein